jgi:hypothetical protein
VAAISKLEDQMLIQEITKYLSASGVVLDKPKNDARPFTLVELKKAPLEAVGSWNKVEAHYHKGEVRLVTQWWEESCDEGGYWVTDVYQMPLVAWFNGSPLEKSYLLHEQEYANHVAAAKVLVRRQLRQAKPKLNRRARLERALAVVNSPVPVSLQERIVKNTNATHQQRAQLVRRLSGQRA